MFCPVRFPIRLVAKVVARIVFRNDLFEKRGERAPITRPTAAGQPPAPTAAPPTDCGCDA